MPSTEPRKGLQLLNPLPKPSGWKVAGAHVGLGLCAKQRDPLPIPPGRRCRRPRGEYQVSLMLEGWGRDQGGLRCRVVICGPSRTPGPAEGLSAPYLVRGSGQPRAGMRRREFRRQEPAPALFGLSPAQLPQPARPPHPGKADELDPELRSRCRVGSGERGDQAARGSPAWLGASPPPRFPFMACVRACDRGERDRGRWRARQRERERGCSQRHRERETQRRGSGWRQ